MNTDFNLIDLITKMAYRSHSDKLEEINSIEQVLVELLLEIRFYK